MLEASPASDADELWCLGDLVGYGADPDACVELAREHAAVCLAGNHDLAVTGEIPLEDFSRGASVAAQWTREVIDPRTSSSSAASSPQGAESAQIGLYHASPRDPIWEYVLSALLAELCLDRAAAAASASIGHSHVALSFERPEGEPATGEPRARRRRSSTSPSGEWLLNPGSVGQPRDGDPRAAWLLLDLDALRRLLPRAPTTTSPAPQRRSARRACPTRSPSAWSTVNEQCARLHDAPSARACARGRRARRPCALLVSCGWLEQGLIPTRERGAAAERLRSSRAGGATAANGSCTATEARDR